MSGLSHVDGAGRARMVDVGDKPATDRRATAQGLLRCDAATVAMVVQERASKGAVIATAELAGVMGAKRTAELVPLCHPLPLTKIGVTVTPEPAIPGFRVTSEVRASGPTGVEMEALTAVSLACLTLFDMLKGVDRGMSIEGVRVTGKSGGRSGDWPSP